MGLVTDRAHRPADRRRQASGPSAVASRQFRRLRHAEGLSAIAATVERLMVSLGLEGASRGKPVRTTIIENAVPSTGISMR